MATQQFYHPVLCGIVGVLGRSCLQRDISRSLILGENNFRPSFLSFLYSPCEKQQAGRVSLLGDNLRMAPAHCLLPGTGNQEERQLLGLPWE